MISILTQSAGLGSLEVESSCLLGPWASSLNSVCFCFLIYKVRIIGVPWLGVLALTLRIQPVIRRVKS